MAYRCSAVPKPGRELSSNDCRVRAQKADDLARSVIIFELAVQSADEFTMENKISSWIAITLLGFTTGVHAEHYPFDSDSWNIDGEEAEVVEHLGRSALRLKGAAAELNGVDMEEGIIEFDVAVTPARGFVGGFFRKTGPGDYENFYIRPHQSGNADANQYNPVFNGIASWQLYHGPGYGEAVEYRYDEWMHIKIAFGGDRADIYVDSETPTIRVRRLLRPTASGRVGVNASNFAPGHFSNFEISELPDDYRFAPWQNDPPPREFINSWQVSDAFSSDALEGIHELGTDLKENRRWTKIYGWEGGITNLAQVQGISEDANTTFARLVIESDSNQTKGIRFGYSDDVAVFVNGALVYSGSNFYMSRDYRYLGTIGLFDRVVVPLKAGDNEVWFAVTENFGGWGIQAKLDDLNGITLK